MPSSFSAGAYFAPNFGQWSIPIFTGITATGSQTLTMLSSVATTPDGIQFIPFVVNGKITVGTGSTQETVTVTAVSGASLNVLPTGGAIGTCSVTATFSNTHAAGELVTSGDNGIMEAINFAQNNGGGQVKFLVDCGIITLSTSGATTTSTAFVPSLFYNHGCSARVTTTITTATDWAVGIAGATSTFGTANSTLTAGTTDYTKQGTPAVALATGATAATLTAVLITCTGTAGAGAVRVKVWGWTPAQSAA